MIKKDVNPEWNEDLTLSVTDPDVSVKLVRNSSRDVYSIHGTGTESLLHFQPRLHLLFQLIIMLRDDLFCYIISSP